MTWGDATGAAAAPASVSARALLRGSLPAMYRENDFAMRFIAALEELLDPAVAVIDNFAAYFDPDVAPRLLVQHMGAWLGAELHENWPLEHCRQVVSTATEINRFRGTRGAIERELRLRFPGLELTVIDGGRTAHATRSEDLPPPGPAEIVVICDTPVPDEVAAALPRAIESVKPAHVAHRLMIRAPREE